MNNRGTAFRRVGAWFGLALLVLEILLGTAIPVARAAQGQGLIPIADLAVCTLDGMIAVPAGPEGRGQSLPQVSVFCSACLPLVHLLAAAEPTEPAQPLRVARFVFTISAQAQATTAVAVGFSARAPPLSV